MLVWQKLNTRFMKKFLNVSVLSFMVLIGLTLSPQLTEASFPVEGCAGGSNNTCCVIWECNNCNSQPGYQVGVLCTQGDRFVVQQ